MIKNVSDAYRAIHGLGAAHGDVREENILVREDDSVVLVDFERTEISGVSDKVINCEDRTVEALLSNLAN